MLRTRNYFSSKFIPTYDVTAADMNDLCDSVIFTEDDLFLASNHLIYFNIWAEHDSVNLSGLNLIYAPDICRFLVDNINLSNNQLTAYNSITPNANLNTLNFNNNALGNDEIQNLLTYVASLTQAVAVDVAGGTNAGHSTWDSDTLAAEATIIANGGSVSSNP